MKSKLFTFCLLCLSYFSYGQVTLTYTGNMGVLLTDGQQSVLIDGLHEYYGPAYLPPSPQMVQDLSTKGGRYEIPQVILFTHHHGDHCSAKLVQDLDTNIVGPEQVISTMLNRSASTLHQVNHKDYRTQTFKFPGINIEAVAMDHTYKKKHAQVQNIGYLVHLGGLRILHVGDTDWYQPMLETLDLKSKHIDVAIIPIWLLMDQRSQQFMGNYLGAKSYIITHIDPRMDQQKLSTWKNKFPEAIFFVELGQQLVLP